MKLNIITTFTFRREIKKVNRSYHIDKAILNAIDHLQKNHYRASIAEIHHGETGKLYAVITRNIKGQINIIYKTDDVFVASDTE